MKKWRYLNEWQYWKSGPRHISIELNILDVVLFSFFVSKVVVSCTICNFSLRYEKEEY